MLDYNVIVMFSENLRSVFSLVSHCILLVAVCFFMSHSVNLYTFYNDVETGGLFARCLSCTKRKKSFVVIYLYFLGL